MKFRDMSIGAQMSLGLGAILFLVLLLGGAAWQQTDRLWAETEGLYNHPLQVRRAVGEIKADVLAMHRSLKDAALAESDVEIVRALQEVDRFEADARRQFSILYDRYLGSRSDIEAIERLFTEWRMVREDAIRLLHAGQAAEATQRTTPAGAGGQQVDAILAALQKVSDFATERADRFFADAQAERAILRVRLALMLASILALTVGISYLLVHNMLEPLRELTAVADRQRAGQLDARSRYAAATRNELAGLATAFNALADAIQTELQRRASAAAVADVMLRARDLEEFCQALLAALRQHTGAQVAALYLLNEAKTAFEHYASIGLAAEARGSFAAAAAEGEFDAALATRQIQHIRDIPADTPFRFVTASGDFRPAAILAIPLLAGQQVMALISLASLRPYSPAALRLVNDLWHVMAARLNGVLSRRQIERFAARLEQQNRELEAQKVELDAQANKLTEQNLELELQSKQLDEANRLKSRFLSNISHELRTPLNSVIALAGVLSRRLRGIAPDEEYGYLGVIERNSKHLLALINDILDLARIEAGREEVAAETFSVHELAAEVIALIAPQAHEKGLALRNEVAADLPAITSDRVKCRHILQNLIGNAVKFTEVGQVTVHAAVQGDTMAIAVADTGIGIAAEQLPFIFDEFRQADDSAARKYGGVGLGLAIARKYAMMLGGDITAASTPGRGSTFTVTLPLAIASRTVDVRETANAWPAGHPGVAPREPAATPSSGRRLLLVEDSEPAAIQMRDILANEGYEVVVARGGREALAQIAAAPPDALILDLMMPEVDGFAVLRAVRANPATAHLPVLILTARRVTPEELAFLVGNNIQQLIQKGDISKAELLAAVARLVGRSGGERGAPRSPETDRSGK